VRAFRKLSKSGGGDFETDSTGPRAYWKIVFKHPKENPAERHSLGQGKLIPSSQEQKLASYTLIHRGRSISETSGGTYVKIPSLRRGKKEAREQGTLSHIVNKGGKIN